MRKIALCLCLLLVITAFSGCDLWMNGQYYSEQLHVDDSSVSSNTELEVSSYAELLQTLTQLTAKGTDSAVIYYSEIDRSAVNGYMERAIDYVMNSTPIGAYAVSGIEFDSGTNTGKQAVAVSITYNHSRSEILRIRQAENMDKACTWIDQALRNCDAGITVQVGTYSEMDMMQYVQDFVSANPDVCMEMPQVSFAVYPDKGDTRVLEVLFFYQTSREDLRHMQQTVEPIFDSAELYVSGDAEIWEKYFQLYSFLMERHQYQVETSITPTYHLLRHGVGDSKAFATVYAAMCRRAGLPCQVVTGTRDGVSWYWNVIEEGEQFYYVDLLACDARGSFTPRTREEMNGYVWDYDRFGPDLTEP